MWAHGLHTMKSNSYLYAVFLAAFMASPAMGYQVNCGTNGPFTATQITSVFGEARPPIGISNTGYVGPAGRFHKGVDIVNNCAANALVFPIEAGIVTNCLGFKNGKPTSDSGIRVQGQHTFDYIHVNILSSICDSNGNVVNASVNPMTSIGAIIPLGTNGASSHLHLDQLQTINGVTYDINPETNGLDFSDSDVPQFDMITVGGVTAGLIPIDDDTLSPLSPSSQGETFLSPLFRGYGEPT